MDIANTIQTIALYAIPVLLAITGHEAAHAYAARALGDPTAQHMGRATFNPLKHIDPIGTVLMPLMLYIASSGAFLFGYARPVPVNWNNLRHPRSGMAGVAVAGPAANFVMAVLWTLVLIALSLANPELAADASESAQAAAPSFVEFIAKMAQGGILVNLAMCAFNLLPFPPLDGGRILASALPPPLAAKLEPLERWGMWIVLLLAFSGFLGRWWMLPAMKIASQALTLIISPLSFLIP